MSLACALLLVRPALAESGPELANRSARDGVYGRFDGDLDLGFGLGAEFGSAGDSAFALRGTAHYFSIAGVYVEGRIHSGSGSARSLVASGVDVRPAFVARWAKGFETGPSFVDLALDSMALSVGAFFTATDEGAADAGRGFELGLGGGLPLTAAAAGPWLETRATLRFPESGVRQEAVYLALAWHGFLLTPLSAAD